MPELKKVLIIGGGLAGIGCAIQARHINPSCMVILIEKSDRLLGWMQRKGLNEYPLGFHGKSSNPYPDRIEDWLFQERLIANWSISNVIALLGIEPETCRDGGLASTDLDSLKDAFCKLLDQNRVEVKFGFSVESISAQPDATYRVWSRDGDGVTGDKIILATGGERNHGMKLAAESGVAVTPPIPAFVRLKLASLKLGDRMGPLERHVKVSCLRSGSKAVGSMTISSRGLEGPAISRLSAQQCVLWNQLGYQVQLVVDWLPGQTGASVLKELLSRSETGGKRLIAETPMFAFPGKSWCSLLKSAKSPLDSTWSRIKTKKLQALANRIKADRITASGMGLPEGERAWSGGININSLNQRSLESQSSLGIHFAGEILNLHGMPGGDHLNLLWATAMQAGTAAASFD